MDVQWRSLTISAWRGIQKELRLHRAENYWARRVFMPAYAGKVSDFVESSKRDLKRPKGERMQNSKFMQCVAVAPLILASSLLMVSSDAVATGASPAQARTCDIDDLLGQCEMFDSAAGHMEGRDQSLVLGDSRRASADAARLQENWGRTALGALERAPGRQDLGESFRRWLVSEISVNTLNSLRSIDGKKEAVNFEVPWPIEQADARLTRVSATDLRARLVAAFGEGNYASLLQAAEAQAAATQQAEASRRQSVTELMNERVATRRTRAADLIERARQRTIETIRNGRDLASLPEAERNLLRRLETLRIDFENNINCSGALSPGGSYDASAHQVNMCAPTAALPDEAIMLITAHEMAHAIDPCASRGPLIRVDADRLRQVRESMSTQLRGGDAVLLNSLTQSSGFAQLYPQDVANPLIQRLLREGVLSVDQPALRTGEHPFRGTLVCLTQPATGGFRLGPWQLAQQGQGHHRCAPDTLNEGFCDWLAAEVLGRELGTRSPRPRPERDLGRWRREAMGVYPLFARDLCFPDPGDPTPENVASLRPEEWEGRSHPPARLRVESVLFRNPRLREHFGCRTRETPAEAGPPHCEFPLARGQGQRIGEPGATGPNRTRGRGTTP
mgnify:CR=1 FL=1